MISAGLDTVPGNVIMGIAYLSSPHGQKIQKVAYDEIMKVYPDGDAWEKCLVEEKVPYVTALVREILRFFTVIPINLPRTSIKDVRYGDAIIPAGTTFYIVNPSLSSRIIHLAYRYFRIIGPPTTIRRTSKTQTPSGQNAILTSPNDPVCFTILLEPVPECAPALISRTVSFTLPSSAS
jgi:Cytochrome P450